MTSLGRRLAQRGARGVEAVRHDAEVAHLAAERGEQAAQGVAVGVVDAAGLQGSPGIDSSSPVKNTATRSRRNTGSVASPTEAARPMSCGAGACRRRGSRRRRRMSSPARRMFSPASRHVVDLHDGAGVLAQLLHHHRIGALPAPARR
jgi:hypothetical protein